MSPFFKFQFRNSKVSVIRNWNLELVWYLGFDASIMLCFMRFDLCSYLCKCPTFVSIIGSFSVASSNGILIL
jgi:hypothetical protein